MYALGTRETSERKKATGFAAQATGVSARFLPRSCHEMVALPRRAAGARGPAPGARRAQRRCGHRAVRALDPSTPLTAGLGHGFAWFMVMLRRALLLGLVLPALGACSSSSSSDGGEVEANNPTRAGGRGSRRRHVEGRDGAHRDRDHREGCGGRDRAGREDHLRRGRHALRRRNAPCEGGALRTRRSPAPGGVASS